MKITHSSGQEYHLSPETKLELTRYNPFFHDMGEQSVPISLPSTARNLHLLGNPQSIENLYKIQQRLDARIETGAYTVAARQAIHSVRASDNIDTSFYLNDGAFYEKIKDSRLIDLFDDKKIDFASIDDALSFMYNIISTNDSRFACFSVITDRYILNEHTTENLTTAIAPFVHAVETTELEGETVIAIPKGFYITPFVKAKHLLEEVFASLGYTLLPSFLDDSPFKDMCFLNNNIDTIVKNSIDYKNLVPDIKVSELLEIFRKFNLEFIPDEISKTVKILLFNDYLNDPKVESLDKYLSGDITVSYPGYSKIKLSSDDLPLPEELTIQWRNTGEYTFKTMAVPKPNMTLSTLLKMYPTATFQPKNGKLTRQGIKGSEAYYETIGTLAANFETDDPLTEVSKSFPDVIPDVLTTMAFDSRWWDTTYPYVGSGRALNSSIQYSNVDYSKEESTDELKNKDDVNTFSPMLCLKYFDEGLRRDVGTLSNYNTYSEKLWDYSLYYNGEHGIYEKFWRNRDNLMRNSLVEIEANLLLPEIQKMGMSGLQKVSLKNQKLILSELEYIPGVDSEGRCKLLTTQLKLPVDKAKTYLDYLNKSEYRWHVSFERIHDLPNSAYTFRYKKQPVMFYPDPPTEAQVMAGGSYYVRDYEVEFGTDFNNNGTIEFRKKGDGILRVSLQPYPIL